MSLESRMIVPAVDRRTDVAKQRPRHDSVAKIEKYLSRNPSCL